MNALLLIILFLLVILFIYIETTQVELSFYKIPVDGLPAEYENLLIAHITDIHYSNSMKDDFLKRMILEINRQKPDIIFITGDLGSYRSEWIMKVPDFLTELESRFGTYIVFGNHDHRYGRYALENKIIDSGIVLLKNEKSVIQNENPDKNICIIGLDDPVTYRDDSVKAFKNLPDRGLIFLLSHSPDGIRPAIDKEIPFIFAGHTHGGQIRLPFLPPFYIPLKIERKFYSGLFRYRKSWIFVNRGLGTAGGVPVRLFCPREIAFFSLTSKGEKPVKTIRII